MRHVGAGARGTTASTARCCAICSSRCTTTRRKGRRCCTSVASRVRTARHQDRLLCHKLNMPRSAAACATSHSTCRAEREERKLAQEGRDAAKPGDAHRARWAARWASCVGQLVWGCAAEPVTPRRRVLCDCVGGGGDRGLTCAPRSLRCWSWHECQLKVDATNVMVFSAGLGLA